MLVSALSNGSATRSNSIAMYSDNRVIAAWEHRASRLTALTSQADDQNHPHAADGSAVLRATIMISISSRSRPLRPWLQGSGDVGEDRQWLADGVVLRAEEPEGHLARSRWRRRTVRAARTGRLRRGPTRWRPRPPSPPPRPGRASAGRGPAR